MSRIELGRTTHQVRQVVANCDDGTARRLAWISFQADGSISVGLNDRAFRVPQVEAIDGPGKPVTVDHTIRHPPRGYESPHFTFHPPAKMHFGVEGEDKLHSWLSMVTLDVADHSVCPWITLWTRRLDELPSHESAPRRSDVPVAVDWKGDLAASARLDFDFVAPTTPCEPACRYQQWKDVNLRVRLGVARPGMPGFRADIWT
jgi:hypothetical protein